MAECGFNGNIPENYNGEPAPQENQGGADTSKGTPNKSVFDPSPQEGSYIYILTKEGNVTGHKYPVYDEEGNISQWGITDNTEINGSYDHIFPTEEEADQYIINNDMRVAGRAANISNIDSRKPFTGGFLTRNSYAVSSDAEKWVARKITELAGNTWEGTRLVSRFTQLNILGKASESARFLEEAANTGKSLDQILAEQPDEVISKTVAGRLLNTSRYMNQYFYNKYAPLRALAPGNTGTTSDYARYMERSLQTARAQACGESSFAKIAYRSLQQIFRNNKLDYRTFEKFMLANHTYERIELLQKQFDAINDAIPKAKSVEEADRLKNELREFKTMVNYKNPTMFTFETKGANGENVSLIGKEAADAFLGTLSDDVKAEYEKAAQMLKRFRNDMLERKRVSNSITGSQYEIYSNFNYYMPLRELEEDGSRFETQLPVHIMGRSTEAQDPLGQLFRFLEDGVYRSHVNTLYKNVVNDILASKNMDIGYLNYAEVEPTKDGLSYKIKNKDPNALYILNHGETKPEIMAFHFRMDTELGKRMAEALNKNGQMSPRASMMMHVVAGYTRWTSMLVTTFRPAMFVNNTFWNLGLGIGASQQAFNLPTRGVLPFLTRLYPNIGRTAIEYFKDYDNRSAAFKLFQSLGGGTSRYSQFDITRGSRDIEISLQPVQQALSERPIDAIASYGRGAVNKITHLSHTPDIALQAAAFKTYLEHASGRSWSDPKDLNDLIRYMNDNPEVIKQALDGSRRMLPNFAQAGSQTAFTSFFPFFNATVQTLPFFTNILKTPTGAASLGAALVAGYFGEKWLHDDYGNKGNDVAKAHNGVYIGNGNVIPIDYAYRFPLEIGAALYRHMEQGEDIQKGAGSLVRPALEMLSPMLPPAGSSNAPSWYMAVSPAIVKPFVSLAFGINSFGQSVDAENPIDPETGSKIINPHPSDYGKPSTPAWAIQVSKATQDIPVIGSLMYPGRIAEFARDIIPPVTSLYDSIEGSSMALHNRDATTTNILRDIFAPSTHADPNLFSPTDEYKKTLVEMLNKETGNTSVTSRSLLESDNPRANEINRINKELEARVRRLYVTDQDGKPYKRSDIIHAINQSLGKGDNETANTYKKMLYNIQEQADDLYTDALNRLKNVK